MTLEVIGAGMGRTGTESLRLALQILDLGPCHHMVELRADAALVPPWLTAIQSGATPDFDTALEGFTSQLDWPGAYYWRELADWAPNAKVILTTRGFDGWYASMQQTILPFVALKGRHHPPHRNDIAEFVDLMLTKQFGGKLDDPAHAKAVFEAHIETVKATIPNDHLLVLPVGAGWRPLCDFFGLPVPDADYPSGNTTKDFQDRIAANLRED
ncbi:sulfotransferase family protein [uncultured Litoreibacter sp.]|uniref:sulfotransferase family protein n=1 Tax=uncultured Litoreibacter sp. TaxID=1392394 RepID=UPI002619E2A0|nr:sulfotransferase family protein [uncultured Litoreibacter sp.]